MFGSRLTNFMRLRHRSPSTQDREGILIGAAPESEIVEVKGIFVGVAARHALGYRFVAMDPSVLDMSESIWPTLDHLRRTVAQRRGAFLRRSPHSRRAGAALAGDEGPGLIDHIRLTLNSFDW